VYFYSKSPKDVQGIDGELFGEVVFMKNTNELIFDVSSILQKVNRLPKPKVKGVSINLPFLSIDFTVSNDERKIAKEIMIRLKDKRVLDSWQCCGSCIKHAVDSIQDIRALLVDKQVELSNENSALFILCDLMLYGIRQFLTLAEFYKPFANKTEYQEALDILRGHLLRCLDEIAKIGDVSTPTFYRQNFNPDWEKKIYYSDSSLLKTKRKKAEKD